MRRTFWTIRVSIRPLAATPFVVNFLLLILECANVRSSGKKNNLYGKMTRASYFIGVFFPSIFFCLSLVLSDVVHIGGLTHA
jgi:hypothetical protein